MDPQNPPQAGSSARPRTIIVDLAKLIKANKLSQSDLKSLDKNLRDEVMAYASILQEAAPTSLNIRTHAIPKPGVPIAFGAENHLRSTAPEKEVPKKQIIRDKHVLADQGKIPPAPEPQISTPPKVEVPPPPPPPPLPPTPPPPPKPVQQFVPKAHPVAPPIPPLPPKPPVTPPIPPVSHPVAHKSSVNQHLPTSAILDKSHGKHQPQISSEEKIQAALQDIVSKKTIAEKEINELMSEKNARIHAFEGSKNKEKEIEEEETRIRRELNEAQTVIEKKALEEKRWSLEDERQILEKSRWELLTAADEVDVKITAKKKEINDLANSERENKKALEKFQIKQKAEEAKVALKGHEDIYEKIVDRKKKYEAEWTTIKNSIDELKALVEEKKKTKEEANRKFEEAEKKEKETTDEKKKHALEQERWEADTKLREASKELWATEEEVEKKTEERKELEQTFAVIQTEEEEILEKIAEAKIIIQKASFVK